VSDQIDQFCEPRRQLRCASLDHGSLSDFHEHSDPASESVSMISKVDAIATSAVLALALAWSAPSVRAQSVAVSSISPPSAVRDFTPIGKPPDTQEVAPLVDWLPIWGQEAREKGFDLPLPFGVGLTYTYMKQNMVVSDVTIEGRPVGVTLRDAETVSDTVVFRADAWLFPFLNVYGLVGHTAGVTRPAVVFSNGEVLKSEVKYDRPSYGAGTTLAAGYKAWFATVDANWTTGSLVSSDGGQISDEPIQSITATPRTGLLFNTEKGGVGALWIGAMYITATSEIHDVIDLRQHPVLVELVGRDSLNVSARVSPRDKWNYLLGGNWQPDKRWSLTAEAGGLADRFQFIGSVMWRF
jgi:hypothetical protein